MRERLRLEVSGAVQGVGFRPFVYRLATDLALAGFVVNDSRGVFIEVEGIRATLQEFARRLESERPEHSVVLHQRLTWLGATGEETFAIRHSDESGDKTVLVLPDLATCPDCRAEIARAGDRRHGYPFTNCTHCGPRFSIIERLPYDRPHTTMKRFTMCASCQREYDSPEDRRFHAQPNACPVCGPSLELWDATGAARAVGHAALVAAGKALGSGQVLAVKGLGGFHLVVDATSETAVATLRARKRRPAKPLAVMAHDLERARELVEVSEQAAAALTSPRAPIVLLPARTPSPLAGNVAPEAQTLGIMLPYTPLHQLLLAEIDFPVVATSGNLSEEPICTEEQEARRRLESIADLLLVHDRPIHRHVDDSVMWELCGEVRPLRRARGLAPLPVVVRDRLPTLLAVGAHLKNTIALSVGEHVFISQHIGDLETLPSQEAFERTIGDLLALYEAEPVAIAHDLHPDYVSTRWAKQSGLPCIPVQHHHAHLAAVLADNGVDEESLGVIWDGAGLGADGVTWGGEMLLGSAAGFSRVAHFRPFRLAGGDAAVREPWRTALALLWEVFAEEAFAIAERIGLPVGGARAPLQRMLESGLRSPWCTSAGRLFDGVAALAGIGHRVTYEGQAAVAFETLADTDTRRAYQFGLGDESLDWEPLVRAVLADLDRGTPVAAVASGFHNALVDLIAATAERTGCPRIALSGGCFQNRRLCEAVHARLSAAGFKVLMHRSTPPNDGGLSLGQIMVAGQEMLRP
jgi:hydrogenase maturation protein HypF